ncbi:siderophore ABC transporter substrate-binding protein [Vibrio makurazakiensis]|uniref:siderophore ABC transporter substrate-binding protein n=1 Tax=Vibrio makurazakiensis TaxID=2910250 RepID=UPI003D0FD75B
MKVVHRYFIQASTLVLMLVATSTSIAKTITVSHPMGSTTLETKPERVIVLGMDSLDVLDHLGVKPIGVVKAPMPTYLNEYQDTKFRSVGSLFEPNFEVIYSLKPDLIIVSNRSSESMKELSEIAPTVLFMADPAEYWETSQDAWRMLGMIFEQEKRIEQTIVQQQAQINEIRLQTKAQQANALTVMTNGGNLSTFGQHSRYSAIYQLFGFQEAARNIKTSRHGDLISFEYIATANPDYLLVLDRDQAIGRSQGKALQQFNNPLINNTSAARNKKIAHLNAQAWYISASGITATQLMIDDMKGVLK